MSYDPSATSVRERILADVQTVLAAIAPPSYATTVRHVRRWNGNVQSVSANPCALIVPLPEKSNDDIVGIISHTMELGLLLGLVADTWRTDINKFLADVRVALLADPSRGGIAVTTRITDENVSDTDPEQSLGEARVIVQILYRTTFDNPNEPR